MRQEVTIELGGQEMVASFTYHPGDPGVTSGPVERCYEPEPEEFVVWEVKLLTGLDAAGKPTFFDITDLVEDLGGTDKVQEEAQRIAEHEGRLDPDDEGPEPDDLDRLQSDPMYAEPGTGYPL